MDFIFRDFLNSYVSLGVLLLRRLNHYGFHPFMIIKGVTYISLIMNVEIKKKYPTCTFVTV